MEGKQKFDYDKADESEVKKNEKNTQEMMVKVLQVILGIVMAILHA